MSAKEAGRPPSVVADNMASTHLQRGGALSKHRSSEPGVCAPCHYRAEKSVGAAPQPRRAENSMPSALLVALADSAPPLASLTTKRMTGAAAVEALQRATLGTAFPPRQQPSRLFQLRHGVPAPIESRRLV